MIRRHFKRTAMGIAILLCALLAHATAQAQTRGPLAINNNTACAQVICLSNGGPCVTVAPGTSVTVQIPCNTTQIDVVLCGVRHTIQLGNCVNRVNAGGCCADVCFVPGIVGCTFFLTFNPAPAPCLCPLG